jgi:hypothetical protein
MLYRNPRAVGQRSGRPWMMAGNQGFFVDGSMHIQQSNDGIAWNNRSTSNGDTGNYSTYSSHDGMAQSGGPNMMGCPCIFSYNSKIYALGSVGITTTDWAASHFEIAASSDGGNTYSYVATADFTSFFGTQTHPQTWSTSAFIDQGNVVHVIFEYTPNSDLSGDSLIYHLYETHDTSGGFLTSWSTPVQITGTSSSGYIGLQSGNSQIDGFILTDDFVTYYLFFKNDHSGKKCIEVSSSSTLTGPYTTSFEIDDWAGWSTSGGVPLSVPMEAPRRLKMSDRNRMYLDQQGTGMYYSDNTSGNTVAAMFTGTWSAPALITYPSGDFASGHAQHISVIATP